MLNRMLLALTLAIMAASAQTVSADERASFDRDALEQVQRKLAELKVRSTLAFTAFSTIGGQSRGDIYMVSAIISKRITNALVDGSAPAWSPDGTKLAFASGRAGRAEIYTIDVDRTNLEKLTEFDGPEDAFGDSFPSWSPDGARIVFESHRNDARGDNRVADDAVQVTEPTITAIDADGSNRIVLRNGHWPRWWPDGTQILFHSVGDEPFAEEVDALPTMAIYTMSPDGRDARRLTDLSSDAMFGCWSLDGKQIAFVSNRDREPHQVANLDLYVMNADGSQIDPVR